MFFEMKQDAIKQGWLQKKGRGAGTLGRSGGGGASLGDMLGLGMERGLEL